MSKAKKKTDLSQKVMDQIQKKKVKMRPRLYFVFGSLLLGLGLLGVMLLTIFFTNLVLFRMRVHGPWDYLRFGHFGVRPFLVTFPWLPLLMAIGGVLGGLALLRRYDISYQKSFLGLVLGLVIFVLASGFVLDHLGFNERAERLEHLDSLYQERFVGPDWVVGEVVETGAQTLVIITPNGEEITVIKTEKTILPFGQDFLVGDRVRVVGEWQGEVFMAKGMAKGGLHWQMDQRRPRRLQPPAF